MEKLISEFSFGLFFWQLLIFIFLVLLLKKFAWKPILDTVNERESSIKKRIRALTGEAEDPTLMVAYLQITSTHERNETVSRFGPHAL